MKRASFVALFTAILILAFILYPTRGSGEVNVNIGIGVPLPPPVVISAPPPVVVIPQTYVYFVPDIEVDILFYHGNWYRPHQGRWYRATSYGGPWVHIEHARVPRVLTHLPPNYRHVPPGYERIPHGQLKKNWRTWEKDKHWDKHEAKTKHAASQGKSKHKEH